MMGIKRALSLIWNSVCYMRYRSPLIVSAYVEIRGGKVQHRNWGDDINVFLLEKISGRKVIIKNQSLFHKMKDCDSYLCIGSTIGFIMDKYSTVWGAGAMYPYKSLPCTPKKICSVRGPLTRKVFLDAGIECPEAYGDPALLVSQYYQPSFEKKYKLGIIAHYTDEDNPILKTWVSKHPEVLLISMSSYKKWEEIPDRICSCEEIWSSSLHGLIVSDSYSVPNRWVRFNGKIVGGGFKFLDYLQSVRRQCTAAEHLESEASMDDLYSTEAHYDPAVINFEAIINSCPLI